MRGGTWADELVLRPPARSPLLHVSALTCWRHTVANASVVRNVPLVMDYSKLIAAKGVQRACV